MELQLTLIIVILILLVLFLALAVSNYMCKLAIIRKDMEIVLKANEDKKKKLMNYDRVVQQHFQMVTDDFVDMLEHVMVGEENCVVTTKERLQELERIEAHHNLPNRAPIRKKRYM